MDKIFFESILAKIFHDMLSPISSISLAVESVCDEIDKSTAEYINSGLEDFKTRLSIFKIISSSQDRDVSASSIKSILKADAAKHKIDLAFNGLPSTLTQKTAKTLCHLYILAKKAVAKNGSVTFNVTPTQVSVEAVSSFPINVHNDLNAASTDTQLTNCSYSNIETYWAVNQVSSDYGGSIEASTGPDGTLHLNVCTSNT